MEHSPFSLPVTNPVAVFAIVMLVILAAPLVFTRLRIPGIVGLIIAGVVIGPHTLGLLERGEVMELLGTVGLLYIMFIAGLEIDLNQFNRYRKQSLGFSVLTYGIPQVLGTYLGLTVLGFSWPASILLGSIIASHTLVAYPIVSRFGLAKNAAVTTAVGATIITDSLALFVLAVIAGSAEGELNLLFWVRLLGGLAIFVAGVFWVVPRLGRWFFRMVAESDGVEGYVFVLAVVFTCALLAEWAGVEPIIGAFLAGLALNRLVPEQGTLMNRVQFVGESLFIPFFLISVGMLVDVGAFFAGAGAWIVAGSMLAAVLLAKGLAAFATRWMFRYTMDECWIVFGMTVAQAAATLAAVLIGVQVGLFETPVLNGTIFMILVTCLIGPWLAERYGRRVALAEAHKPYEPTEAPQRILVPLVEEATAGQLVELAILLRDPKSEQPIYPLTVARNGANVDALVAKNGKILAEAARRTAAADVPVVPLTRVAYNPAAGIGRAITEEQITTVLLAWDGADVARPYAFGRVLDGLLARSREMILICKIASPLNTIRRVVLAVPPFADREAGFPQALRAVKILANQLGARMLAIAPDGLAPILDEALGRTRPEVPGATTAIPDWSNLLPKLDEELQPDDLLVILGAREGTLAWRPALSRLPHVVAQRFATVSQVFLYPSEVAVAPGVPSTVSTPVGTSRDPAAMLDDMQVQMEICCDTWEQVLTALLGPANEGNSFRLKAATRALLDWRSGYSPERHPGLAMLHAHVPDLERAFLFVGVSTQGLNLPQTAHPIHAVVVLLSPERPDSDAYLNRLDFVARIVRPDDVVMRLRAASSPSEVRDVLRSNSIQAPVAA